MKKITIIILFLTVAATLPAQIERGTVTDADGNIYPTAKLGDYWWMTENLRTRHFNNGDEITLYPDTLFPDYALNTRQLKTIFTTGGSNYDGCKHFTYPNRDHDNEAVYGLNYTWWAAMDARGLCPEGWILPDTNIWINLAASTGYGYRDLYRTRYNGELYADIGRYLRSAQYWKEDDTSIAGTDEFGFNALPSGCLEADGYLAFGEEARFWTPHYVMADGSGMGRRYVTLSYNNDLMDFGSFRSNSNMYPLRKTGLGRNRRSGGKTRRTRCSLHPRRRQTVAEKHPRRNKTFGLFHPRQPSKATLRRKPARIMGRFRPWTGRLHPEHSGKFRQQTI